jgi:integrase
MLETEKVDIDQLVNGTAVKQPQHLRERQGRCDRTHERRTDCFSGEQRHAAAIEHTVRQEIGVWRPVLDLLTLSGLLPYSCSGAPTANRYLALVRATLRKAANEWERLEREPKVRMYRENDRRVRFLTREEADRLIRELPMHLAEISRLALATGLRRANITGLEWSQVNLEKGLAWIHADQAKGKRAIPVPLNKDAIEVLKRQIGKHPTRGFSYNGKPVFQTATKAWHKAVKRAGLKDLRFHDLRHYLGELACAIGDPDLCTPGDGWVAIGGDGPALCVSGDLILV